MTNLSLCRDSSVPCCRSRLVAATMAAWGQACRIAARASAASFRKQGMPGAENGLYHGLACSTNQQIRGMASGRKYVILSQQASVHKQTQAMLTVLLLAGAHHGHEVTYKGLTLHAPATWHTYVGKGMCSIMWSVSSSFPAAAQSGAMRFSLKNMTSVGAWCRFWIFYRAYHDGDAFLVCTNSGFLQLCSTALHQL